MPYECGSIAARIPPEVWLEGASNAVRTLPEWPPNVVRTSKNSNRMQLEYLECTSNVLRIDSGGNRDAFEVHSCSLEAHSGHSGRI